MGGLIPTIFRGFYPCSREAPCIACGEAYIVPYLMCLVCGRLSTNSRCSIHRGTTNKGYGYSHQIRRKDYIEAQPFCTYCLHTVDPRTGSCGVVDCAHCPLQLDHVVRLGTQRIDKGMYQVLCKKCNRAKG